MNASQSEAIIQQYLDRVADNLRDLPADERGEIISDLRAHIDEAVGDPALASEVDVRNTLDRLGHPADFAREARERSNDTAPATEPRPLKTRLNKTPGALEVAAIILTALFWPIGVLLAWISPRWLTRDKVIATLIPATATIMLGVIILAGFVAYGTETTTTLVHDEVVPVQPADPQTSPPNQDGRSPAVISESGPSFPVFSRLVIVIGFLGGVLAGPFISAVYLAVRLQPVEEPVAAEPDGGRNGIPARGHA